MPQSGASFGKTLKSAATQSSLMRTVLCLSQWFKMGSKSPCYFTFSQLVITSVTACFCVHKSAFYPRVGLDRICYMGFKITSLFISKSHAQVISKIRSLNICVTVCFFLFCCHFLSFHRASDVICLAL